MALDSVKPTNRDIAQRYLDIKTSNNPDKEDSYGKIASRITEVKESLVALFELWWINAIPFSWDAKRVILRIILSWAEWFNESENNWDPDKNIKEVDFPYWWVNDNDWWEVAILEEDLDFPQYLFNLGLPDKYKWN